MNSPHNRYLHIYVHTLSDKIAVQASLRQRISKVVSNMGYEKDLPSRSRITTCVPGHPKYRLVYSIQDGSEREDISTKSLHAI